MPIPVALVIFGIPVVAVYFGLYWVIYGRHRGETYWNEDDDE